MKKRMKLFSLLLLVVLMSGCVKYNFSMEVGKDKSVDISIISAVSTSLGDMDSDDEDATEEEDSEEDAAMAKKGFKSEDYKTDKWLGKKYTKTYDNIDDISSDKPVKVELADIVEEDKAEPKVYFQKKSSLFKTTYIANFTIDLTEESSDSSISAESLESYGAEFGYDVKLPVKADKENAKTVSEDGKTLTWKLEYGKVNEISYEFSMVNTTLYIIAAVVVAVIIIGIIVVVVNKKKKTPPTQMPNGGMPGTNVNNMPNPGMNPQPMANNVPNMMQPDTQQPFINPSETPNLMASEPLESAVMPQEQPMAAPADLPSLENQPPIVSPMETPIVEAAPEVAPVEVPMADSDVAPVTLEEPVVLASEPTPAVESAEVVPPVGEENKDTII